MECRRRNLLAQRSPAEDGAKKNGSANPSQIGSKAKADPQAALVERHRSWFEDKLVARFQQPGAKIYVFVVCAVVFVVASDAQNSSLRKIVPKPPRRLCEGYSMSILSVPKSWVMWVARQASAGLL